MRARDSSYPAIAASLSHERDSLNSSGATTHSSMMLRGSQLMPPSRLSRQTIRENGNGAWNMHSRYTHTSVPSSHCARSGKHS